MDDAVHVQVEVVKLDPVWIGIRGIRQDDIA